MTSPAVIRPGRGSSRMMLRTVIDLPEPDSPTMPSVSPGSMWKSTPSTALTSPSLVGNCVLRPRTSSRCSGIYDGPSSAADALVSTSLCPPIGRTAVAPSPTRIITAFGCRPRYKCGPDWRQAGARCGHYEFHRTQVEALAERHGCRNSAAYASPPQQRLTQGQAAGSERAASPAAAAVPGGGGRGRGTRPLAAGPTG